MTSQTELPLAETGPMSRARFWSALVVGLVALGILVGLGSWQVERLYWKEALVQRIDERIHGPARPIDDIIAANAADGDVDYLPVEVTGRFDHSAERYFLSTFDGEAGWNVYTPLIVEGRGFAVFVNRGFVPYVRKDKATRPDGLVDGSVTISGLARNAPTAKPGGFFMPDNDPAKNTFFWRSIGDMAQGVDLPAGVQMLPLLVDADRQAVPGGYPVGGQTIVSIPNNHLEYAITWFGIAAALAVLLGALVISRVRARGALRP